MNDNIIDDDEGRRMYYTWRTCNAGQSVCVVASRTCTNTYTGLHRLLVTTQYARSVLDYSTALRHTVQYTIINALVRPLNRLDSKRCGGVGCVL